MKYNFTSEISKNIINTKYLHQNETDFNQAIERVAKEVNKYDKIKQKEMEEKTKEYISNKEFSPAGGIYRAAGNPNRNVSYVNCTTQDPVEDSIKSIGESITNWSTIAAYGQGNGIDISGLRPRGTKTSNTAKTSTGSVSFLQLYDSAMQVIGAENRRGATKPDIWIYHPDSEEFITCKSDIKKLTSQNISIKVDDAFMKAVKNNESIELKWERKDGLVLINNSFFNKSNGPDLCLSKTRNAKDLFNKIATAAWTTGEPGIEFWDTSRRLSNSNYHTNPRYHIVSTNGCSEQKLDAFNTCILSSINLYKMPNNNWEEWLKDRVKFGIRFLDNVILAEYNEFRSPNTIQREKLIEMPRIGLGFTGLADWFVKNDIEYGSDQSLLHVEKIMKIFSEEAYRTSIELGKERGSFKEFNSEWFCKSQFIRQLCNNTNLKLEEITHMRHVCCLSIAPTGTLSMVMSVGGSGVEPLFAPYYIRRERATTGDYISHYVFNDAIINYCLENNITLNKDNVDKLTKEIKWKFTSNIDPIRKVKLMGVISNYIDSGISVTYNLPQTATVNDIENIYFKAWEAGLKSVTVYRDKSREGILLNESNEIKIEKHEAPKRPKTIKCNIHPLIVKGEKWIVFVGLLSDDPYEIFCGKQENIELSSKYKTGTITKKQRGSYILELEDLTKININDTFKNTPSENIVSRLISTNLRHGTDIKYIVHQLEKTEEDNLYSFNKAISRVLKKYIKDGDKVTGEECPTCKSNDLTRQSGCVTCNNCGWSKC